MAGGIPVIPASDRLSQKDYKFKDSLDYIVRSSLKGIKQKKGKLTDLILIAINIKSLGFPSLLN